MALRLPRCCWVSAKQRQLALQGRRLPQQRRVLQAGSHPNQQLRWARCDKVMTMHAIYACCQHCHNSGAPSAFSCRALASWYGTRMSFAEDCSESSIKSTRLLMSVALAEATCPAPPCAATTVCQDCRAAPSGGVHTFCAEARCHRRACWPRQPTVRLAAPAKVFATVQVEHDHVCHEDISVRCQEVLLQRRCWTVVAVSNWSHGA